MGRKRNKKSTRMVIFTKHATDRLMARFGIELSDEEKRLIVYGIIGESANESNDGTYDIKIRNRPDMEFVAIVRNNFVTTVLYNGTRMGSNKYRKFLRQKKWQKKN